MTLIVLESFDMCDFSHLVLKGWQYSNVFASLSTVAARTDNGLNLNGGFGGASASLIRYLLPSDEHKTLTVGYALQLTQPFPPGPILTFYESTGAHSFSLYVASSGQLTLVSDLGPSASTNFFLRPDVWNYIEVSCTLDPTAGELLININDGLALSLTGVNTGTGVFSRVVFNINGVGGEDNYTIDDVYITNGAGSVETGMLGDLAVVAIRPSGNGDESQLVNDNGNSTDNYSYINSAGYQTTTFVESPTAGDEDTYDMSALPYATGVVLGVQTVMLTNKNNTGARTFAPVIRESGTDHVGTPVYLGTGVSYQQEIFEEDPGTSAQWTIAGVNDAQFGAQVG